MRRLLSSGGTVLVLLLAACGDVESPDCGAPPSGAIADTVITFLVDGRPVVQESDGWSPGFYRDRDHDLAEMTAWTGTLDDYEWLSIRLTHFHGTGAYPVSTTWQEFPFASITYGCRAVPSELWTQNGLVTDTLYVTAYDSVTTLIEGSFSARLTGYRYNGELELTEGAFRGLLPEH